MRVLLLTGLAAVACASTPAPVSPADAALGCWVLSAPDTLFAPIRQMVRPDIPIRLESVASDTLGQTVWRKATILGARGKQFERSGWTWGGTGDLLVIDIHQGGFFSASFKFHVMGDSLAGTLDWNTDAGYMGPMPAWGHRAKC